jgi:hypothetical protein
MQRPYPPAEILEPEAVDSFFPASDLESWAAATFINPTGELCNPDHSHLESARIGYLWTNVANRRQMRELVGQAELSTPPSSMNRWAKARWEMQAREWFGDDLDFIITVYAPYAATVDDVSFCALIEHELYHCAQRKDAFGFPRYDKDGRPVYGILGHDVEEFVGIVRRYGVGAAAGETAKLVDAAKRVPEVARASIAAACGTCALRLA